MNGFLNVVSKQQSGVSSNSKQPTPHNISMWSIGRKKVLSENQFLKRELITKDSIIEDLRIRINIHQIRESLQRKEIPNSLTLSETVYFDITLVSHEDDCLVYSVSNDSLGFQTEVEVYYSDIINSLSDSNFSEEDLENCIEGLIYNSLNF